jgi:exopolysaccharide production protein ExoZ
MPRYASIESLRGVAAVLVLFAHVKFPVIDACGADALPGVLRSGWGACGVDLFFVISGFVIGLTLDRPGVTWRSFLAARVARVVPVYFLFTAVCLAIPAVVCVPLAPNVVADSFAFLPVFDRDQFAGTIHPYGWTLSFEIWFYLAATGAAVTAGPRSAPLWLAAVFLAGPVAIRALGYDGAWYFPRFALSPLAAEFALGCVAYRVASRPLPAGVGAALLIAGVAGLVLGGLGADRLAVYSAVLADARLAFERVAAWGLPAFLIVTGAATLERRAGRWPARGAAGFLGGISYSVYLVQPIILFTVGSIGQAAGVTSPWAVAGVAATLVLVTATVAHRTVELPLVAGARRRLEGWLAVSRPGGPVPSSRAEGPQVLGTC